MEVKNNMMQRTLNPAAVQQTSHGQSDTALPLITVGIRFHDISLIGLLGRCLLCISAQQDVRVHVQLAVQGFLEDELRLTEEVAQETLAGSGFSVEVENVANPGKVDLRSRLLNRIVDRHYERQQTDYLCFIDFDDIWFSHALKTLVEPLQINAFAVSYADVHCADIYYDSEQIYLRTIRDVFGIGQKAKRDLLKGNFLPLHSYMFHTGKIKKAYMTYDEALHRLEDYDVLLTLASRYAFSGMHRRKLIGLYNFYQTANHQLNTTPHLFTGIQTSPHDDLWTKATNALLARHGGLPWQDFWGEEWVI